MNEEITWHDANLEQPTADDLEAAQHNLFLVWHDGIPSVCRWWPDEQDWTEAYLCAARFRKRLVTHWAAVRGPKDE